MNPGAPPGASAGPSAGPSSSRPAGGRLPRWRPGAGGSNAFRERRARGPRRQAPAAQHRLRRTVDQPGFVDAYEQTAIFSKVSGFIKKFYVDIGQRGEEGRTAGGDLRPRVGRRPPAQSGAGRVGPAGWSSRPSSWSWWPRATCRRRLPNWRKRRPTWESTRPRSFAGSRKLQRSPRWSQETRSWSSKCSTETQKQLDSSKLARDAAEAAVAARAADRVTAEADLGKARIDVETAKAKVKVSEADERTRGRHAGLHQSHRPLRRRGDRPQRQHRRLRAGGHAATSPPPAPRRCSWWPATTWCGSSWTFPRNMPATCAREPRPRCAPTRSAAWTSLRPSPALRGPAREDPDLARAEIDLPAKDYDGLRPGMYVYAKVLIQRANVSDAAAGAPAGVGQPDLLLSCCKDGKAVKTPVERA